MDFIESVKNRSNKDKLGIVLFIIGIIYLLITTYTGITNLGIWYDEIFTLHIVSLPLKEMIPFAISDVHPVLYYFIVKFFIKFFLIFNFTDFVLIGKIVSIIPLYVLGVLNYTKVKKNFGILTSGIFMLCISSMPELMFYSVEIRMYSWALLFVTASFIYIYEIIKDSSWKNWGILTILTICSINTHYFSAIASVILYLFLLAYILHKNRELVKKWILSSLIIILSYIPWLFVLYTQIMLKSSRYWIDPISFKTIISYIYYLLSPATTPVKGNELVTPTILGTVLLISIILIIVYNIKNYNIKNNRNLEINYAISGILLIILIIVSGIVISTAINTTIFHQRYLIPSVGCFWLGISILLSKINKKEIFIPILIVILTVGIIGAVDFINDEKNQLEETIEANQTIQSLIDNGSVVFNNRVSRYIQLESYYLKDCHNLIWEVDDISIEIKNALNDPGIQGEIKNGAKVYFVEGYGTGYQKCIDGGINLKKIDKVTIGGGYTIYEVIL